MPYLLLACLLLVQPPAQSEPPVAKPSLARLLPRLKDVKPEQQAEIKKLSAEYAAMIAELEAERESKLAAVLTREQREALSKLLAEEVDRYRVVLSVKFNRVGNVFKPMKEILGLDAAAAKARFDQAPAKPVADNLPKAKAEALLKALNAAGAKAMIEKQE